MDLQEEDPEVPEPEVPEVPEPEEVHDPVPEQPSDGKKKKEGKQC